MSKISEKTDKLFTDAGLSDQALGYPADVAFVPGDEPWAEEFATRSRLGRHPVREMRQLACV